MTTGYLRATDAAREVLELLDPERGDLRERLARAWQRHLSALDEDLDLPEGFQCRFRDIVAKVTDDGSFAPSIIEEMPKDQANELAKAMRSFAHDLTVAIARERRGQ